MILGESPTEFSSYPPRSFVFLAKSTECRKGLTLSIRPGILGGRQGASPGVLLAEAVLNRVSLPPVAATLLEALGVARVLEVEGGAPHNG